MMSLEPRSLFCSYSSSHLSIFSMPSVCDIHRLNKVKILLCEAVRHGALIWECSTLFEESSLLPAATLETGDQFLSQDCQKFL